MENNDKVFHSEISRVDCVTENHLYDLLKIEPATPIPRHPDSDNDKWEFIPKEKQYLPRTVKSKLKVSTVSNARALYERDVYDYLPGDLEQQKNYLLRKIRDGSSTECKTKKTAIQLLNGDSPISRSAWLMLSNINPEKHKHTKQFVLWNRKCIQVNGSRGGKNKFICNHDLKKKINTSPINSSHLKASLLKSRQKLLRNSLNVKFKPGPLRKKKYLDISHHKYQMGDIELVKLPAPVLEIAPSYGNPLEPTTASFVNNLRGKKGVISPKFAEFAVSVLGTVKNNTLSQVDKTCSVTFDLNYQCNQSRILMRRNDSEPISYLKNENGFDCAAEIKATKIHTSNEIKSTDPVDDVQLTTDISEPIFDETVLELQQILNDMVNSVEISLNQDCMYVTEDDEIRKRIEDNVKDLSVLKDKIPKRKYCELGKLDVTIIKLPESSNKDYSKPCNKSFCTMGCICESLDSVIKLKRHCGVVDCMFGCKCKVAKYKSVDILDQDCGDLLPGLLYLDKEINSHMAKEEQKFHQTVVFSGEKSIILKSRKRSWKCSNKYAEFCNKTNVKSDDKIKSLVTVNVEKLRCDNIEAFCMVHSLYKCFCKGKFIESYVLNDAEKKTLNSLNTDNSNIDYLEIKNPESVIKNNLRPRLRKSNGNNTKIDETEFCMEEKRINNSNYEVSQLNELSSLCARTMGYHGRKHSKDYYVDTNKKITEMEKHDTVLKMKMLKLINGSLMVRTSEAMNQSSDVLDCEGISNDSRDKSLENIERENKSEINKRLNRIEDISEETKNSDASDEGDKGIFVGKTVLKYWLERSYKQYKERIAKGIVKNCLEAPRKGKASLQCWDFILSRYRERKNIFFVSKQEPFRTYLAVDDKHPFFAQCMNIDDIRFADLPKYPIVVQNLVTNAWESDNSFFILRGWDHCWELIGSAVKVVENRADRRSSDRDSFNSDNFLVNEESSHNESDNWFDDTSAGKSSSGREPSPVQGTVKDTDIANETDNAVQSGSQDTHTEHEALEKSKWFVLTIENDFTEIRFYKKGFYVTYEGIQRSIRLARISGKTVRLSSGVRGDAAQNALPYGIYAIPCIIECCVFIGPYEVYESLGIEVVKKYLSSENNKTTKGVWINTNKVENRQVIDNPLAYLPRQSTPSETIPLLEAVSNNKQSMSEVISNSKEIPMIDISTYENENTTPSQKTGKRKEQECDIPSSPTKTPEKETQVAEKTLKQIKPIKIRRTNGFYHLSSNSLLKKISPGDLFAKKTKITKDDEKPGSFARFHPNTEPVADILLPGPSSSSVAHVKPIAEIAPQIKITHVYSQKIPQTQCGTTDERTGMLILKPEEINNKVHTKTEEDMSVDIEKFLETSTICAAPQEILIISDGEEEEATLSNDAWIQCCNVENFGYLRAKTTPENMGISFEFPGFKYSDYYKETEAFDKINQVLARKIYIPKNVKLQWEVVRNVKDLTCDMLTSTCLEDKKYLLTKLRSKKGSHTSNVTAFKSKNKNKDNTKFKEEKVKLIQGLEETSKKLEQENALLWQEAITKRDEIFGCISIPHDLREKMTENLQNIMKSNEK